MAISDFANNATTGQADVTAGGTFTVTKPTGCQNGDLVVVGVCASDIIQNIEVPDGSWIEDFEVDEPGLDSGLFIAHKIISGDGATWNFSCSNSESLAWVAIALRGVHQTTPLGAKDCVAQATATSQVTPSINISDSTAWIICMWEADGPSPGASWTPPASPFVEAGEAVNATNFNSMMAGYEPMDFAALTSRTATSTQNDVYISAILEILPAEAEPPIEKQTLFASRRRTMMR